MSRALDEMLVRVARLQGAAEGERCPRAAPILDERATRTLLELVFARIDFDTQSIATVLREAGYDPGRKTLFLREGVTCYLTADAVDDVLRLVRGGSTSYLSRGHCRNFSTNMPAASRSSESPSTTAPRVTSDAQRALLTYQATGSNVASVIDQYRTDAAGMQDDTACSSIEAGYAANMGSALDDLDTESALMDRTMSPPREPSPPTCSAWR